MKVRTLVVLMMVMVMFAIVDKTYGRVSVIVNGSFENDGSIVPVDADNLPQDWLCDVNFLSLKFGGYVDNDWSTYLEKGYSLTLESYDWMEFNIGDMATISQLVYLEDVNDIFFDLNLNTYWDMAWNPDKRAVVVCIDDQPVWDSNALGDTDIRGEHFDVSVPVAPGFRTEGQHKLSLGLRADEYELFADTYYYVQWDFLRFDTHCDCNGLDYQYGDYDRDCYIDADFDRDCSVGNFDLDMFADKWLEEVDMYDPYNLSSIGDSDPNGTVNFFDFAVFGDSWMNGCSGEDYRLLTSDLNLDGIVNFIDYATIAEDYTGDYNDISQVTTQWLQTSWLYDWE